MLRKCESLFVIEDASDLQHPSVFEQDCVLPGAVSPHVWVSPQGAPKGPHRFFARSTTHSVKGIYYHE